MNNEWLQQLKTGDRVIVKPHYTQGPAYIGLVAHTTKAQIVINSGVRYWKKNGVRIGDDRWEKERIEEATPEAVAAALAEQKRQEYIARLVRVGWKSVSTDRLARIVAILDEEAAG